MVDKSVKEDIAQSVGESVSAAVDGEMNELDLRRILKASEEPAVRENWRRTHLIGAALRNELNAQNTLDISRGVWAALEQEAPLNVSKSRFSGLYSFAGKSAVAASVALAVLVGGRYLPQDETPDDEVLAEAGEEQQPAPVAPITDSLPAGFDSPRVNARVVSASPSRRPAQQGYRNEPFLIPVPDAPRQTSDPKVQAYLNDLMLIHAEQSSQASVIGVLPYVRVPYPQDRE